MEQTSSHEESERMSDAPFFLDPENGPLVVAEGPAKLAPGHFLKHYAPLNSYPLGDWLKIALLNLIPAIFIACFLLIKENPPARTYASALPIACLRGYLCSSTFLFIATFVNRARLDSENEKYHRLMAGGHLMADFEFSDQLAITRRAVGKR